MIEIRPIDLSGVVRRNARVRLAASAGTEQEFRDVVDEILTEEAERLTEDSGGRSGDEHSEEPGD